jgi:hypothetical protein
MNSYYKSKRFPNGKPSFAMIIYSFSNETVLIVMFDTSDESFVFDVITCKLFNSKFIPITGNVEYEIARDTFRKVQCGQIADIIVLLLRERNELEHKAEQAICCNGTSGNWTITTDLVTHI